MSENTTPSRVKITICGLEELPDFQDSGVTHVLSILDPAYPVPDAFGSYGAHARLELRFHDVIEEDLEGFDPPEAGHIEALLGFGRDLAATAPRHAHLLIHCHAGISRSTAAAVLITALANPDRAPADVVAEIVQLRAKAWPNLRMIELGDKTLGLEGELVRAVRDRHRQVAAAQPTIAEYMRNTGRARELD